MILSYEHRFIFLKTRKTAGSSIELALSALCGPRDIITPLLPREEVLRPGRGAQNYMREPNVQGKLRSDGLYAPHRKRDFYDHIGAEAVAARMPEEFAQYFKAGFVRNPWDAQLSRFFWSQRGRGDLSPEGFRRHLFSEPLLGFGKLFIGRKLVADFVGRYETLEADYHALIGKIGVANPPPLPRLKSGVRPAEARDYRAYYDDRSREYVAKECADVIELCGYKF